MSTVSTESSKNESIKNTRQSQNKNRQKHKIYEFQEHHLLPDKNLDFRGHIKKSYQCILFIVVFFVGRWNVYNFPPYVAKYGGISYACVYYILCLFLCIPYIMMEMALCQFYSASFGKVYHIIPITGGLGWTSLMIGFFFSVDYVYEARCSVVYLLHCLFHQWEWVDCTNLYPGVTCLSYEDYYNVHLNLNNPNKEVNEDRNETLSNSTNKFSFFPAEAFFNVKVYQIITANGENNTLWSFLNGFSHDGLVGSAIIFVLLMFWAILIVNFYFKILLVIFSLTILIFFSVVLQVLMLPGSYDGFIKLAFPSFEKTFTWSSIFSMTSQMMYSLAVGFGVVGSIASLCKFKLNLLKCISVSISIDFLVSVSGTILFVCGLGFLNHVKNIPIDKLIEQHPFIIFSEIFGLSNNSRFWFPLFLIVIIIFSTTTSIFFLFAMSVSIVDSFPKLLNFSIFRKNMVTFTLVIVTNIMGLFYALNAISFYDDFLVIITFNVFYPFLVTIQVLTTQFIYGKDRIKIDYKMMNDRNFSLIWDVALLTLPCLSILTYVHHMITVDLKMRFPFVLRLLSFFIAMLVLIPLVCQLSYRLFTVFLHRKTGKVTFASLFVVKDYWGPHYKTHWLLHEFYQRKMIKVKNHPKFLKSVPENENLDLIFIELKKLVSQRNIKLKTSHSR